VAEPRTIPRSVLLPQHVNKRRFLPKAITGLVFFTPFASLVFDLGIDLDFSKLLTILCIPGLIATRRRFGTKLSPPETAFAAFLIYMCAITIAMAPFVPTSIQASTALFRNNQTRWVTQLAVLALNCVAFLACRYIAQVKNPALLAGTLIKSTVVLCGLGIIQVLGFKTGLFSMGVFNALHGQESMPVVAIAGSGMLRMSSLAGEPKTFACFLLPMVLYCSVKALLVPSSKSSVQHLLLALLSFICFIATLSTSAFFALCVAVPILTVTMLKYVKTRTHVLMTAAFGIIVLVPIILIGSTWISAVIETRVTQRMGEIDHPEASTIALLQDRPSLLAMGVGFGNVGFYAHEYLPINNVVGYLRGTTLPLASWGLRLLAEGGVPGTLLFLLFEGLLVKEGFRALRFCSPTERSTHAGLLAAAIGVVAIQPFNASTVQWIVLGAVCGANGVVLSRAKQRTSPAPIATPFAARVNAGRVGIHQRSSS
jgi:hypothetical protein